MIPGDLSILMITGKVPKLCRGFKYFDDNWKSAETVLNTKKHLNDRGINYLVNVGPDALGRFPAPAVEILREVGRKLKEVK